MKKLLLAAIVSLSISGLSFAVCSKEKSVQDKYIDCYENQCTAVKEKALCRVNCCRAARGLSPLVMTQNAKSI